LREVIARHGLGARKALGQHFLLDLNLTRRVVRAAGPLAGVTVIEIGPGPGGLTRALLESDAEHIVAIERDSRCVAALRELAAVADGRLDIVEADALALDPAEMTSSPRRIVANLPYNVATPLLLGWLTRANAYAGFTLMFQKEVADRLVAPVRTHARGRLSILAQWLCTVERCFDISPRAFTPPPGVVSTVVNLTPRAVPLAPGDRATLERVTAAAFGQRRKMLRSSLALLGGAALLEAAGVPGTARAEELSVEQFCALARALYNPTNCSSPAAHGK
ncbi:MAG: 16S rRNA (adenine(1518)-N(6)/adenine(1519)-N(6))-dimethyltransferase RsmA, partial [Alphaproteobacteria bacterium]|nr:16S rRNA (adenine(1518)-N(6)/adenine(1519)-N(6))-dimethyltransferase RsmA [Alphaproteobacteria bacterium]